MNIPFKNKLQILFLLLSSSFFLAQIKISGTVFYKNKGVKDIAVTLKDTYDGATTNEKGEYSFETSEKGNLTLVFSQTQFITVEKPILIEDKNQEIVAVLKEAINEIDAVIISAGSIEASDKKRATTLLTSTDIYTTAGSNGQISSALETLPGVQKVEETEGLFVRGGTGTETKFFMDGNLVNNYFTSSVPGIKGRDRLNTSLFKGNIYSSGGYSALYGQALSSILALESVDLPNRNSADFGISPIFINAGIQRVDKKKTHSFGVSINYSNLQLMDKILKFNTNFTKTPESMAANFNFRIKTKGGGFVKYYASIDGNKMAVANPSLEEFTASENIKMNSNNTFQTLSYREKFGKYTLNAGTSYTYIQSKLGFENIFNDASSFNNQIKTTGSYFNAKAYVEKKWNKISNLKGGIEYNSTKEDTKISLAPNSVFNYKDGITSLFAETDIGISNDFSMKIGARAEHSSILDLWNFAPRLAMAYKVSKNWTTNIAYGRFFQNPESKYFSNSFTPNFQLADHYIYQIQRNSEGRNLRIEAFYKKYDDLIKTNLQDYRQQATSSNGDGFAKGIEFFWRDKKTVKNIDYWISYSYLDSKRDFLNYPQSLFPNFAAKHTLNIVAKKFVTSIRTGFNLSYNYSHGRPFYNFVNQAGTTVLLNSGTIKDNKTLNFSMNYLPNLGKKDAKSFAVWVFSVNNVLGTKNEYGYQFSNDGLKSETIKPAINTFVFIGLFISFGTDKTQDAINSNL